MLASPARMQDVRVLGIMASVQIWVVLIPVPIADMIA